MLAVVEVEVRLAQLKRVSAATVCVVEGELELRDEKDVEHVYVDSLSESEFEFDRDTSVHHDHSNGLALLLGSVTIEA
jgi:hypothetical protein